MSGHSNGGARFMMLGLVVAICIWSPLCLAQPAVPDTQQQRVSCPLWLPKGAFKPDDSARDWTGAIRQEARLSGAGLLHGAPDEYGYLKPHSAKATKTGTLEIGRTRWLLGQPHSYETWLYCSYGPLELFKRIRTDATECNATSRRNRDAFVEVVFVC